ncbi:hypothetical protein MUGA111182_03545 [Mucilaginibacter galii]|uniref:Restriction endonuclease n=1 Tax=Mucilaginibacter galii TaxID=2005073 RepID=A0A917J819_9SPHI|nr:hypothetical protein [Mucilaginibacter galii]GGI50458.1 hypothetical protein GCM10011425_16700 [Mucilaginibacter galii]
MSADVTKIELAKALKAIKAVATEDQFNQTKAIYIQAGGEESVMSSVNGLSEEDEFALLTKLLCTAKHIIGFEQRPLIQGEYTVADYYLTMKPACSVYQKKSSQIADYKCVIDVKSTEKDKFKIGGSKLQKLRNFADLLNLPLYFAVRFLRFNNSALWAIVKDEDRSITSLQVNYSDIVTGYRSAFWDEYSILLNPLLILVAEYSKSSTIASLGHQQHGTQISIQFLENQTPLLKLEGGDGFMTSAFMECFNLEEVEVEKVDDDITRQYLKPTLAASLLADLIFKMNRLPVDEFGRIVYDATKLIVRSDTDAHEKLIDRKTIEAILPPLVRANILSFGIIGNHLERWKQLGGIT